MFHEAGAVLISVTFLPILPSLLADKAALGVWITWQVSGSPLSSLKTASGEENSSPELVPDVFAQIMRQLGGGGHSWCIWA